MINGVISLSQTEKYKKYNVLRKAGYDTKDRGRYLELVSKDKPNLDRYFDPTVRNIDEALTVLADEILKIGYMITV